MARNRYIGLSKPTAIAAFGELEPAHRQLGQMLLKFRPFSPEYFALAEARDKLAAAADLITGERPFYRHVGNSDTGRVGDGWKPRAD